MTCKNCNSITNTTVCEWDFETVEFDAKMENGIAEKCFARFVNGKWERGCAYDQADEFTKHFVNGLVDENKQGEE
jgi:hypothetical protein